MTLKQIKDKILKGEFSDLFLFKGTKEQVQIHPAEVAEVLNSLKSRDVGEAFESFQPGTQTQLFPYLDLPSQKKVMRSLPKAQAILLLNSISSDDRTTFFNELSGSDISLYLEYLSENNKKITCDLLGYPETSVARLMNNTYATVTQQMTVAEACEYLRNNFKDSETTNVAYVLDSEGRLIDDIPVRRFVLSDQHKTVHDILDGFCAKLKIDDSADTAIDTFQKYGMDVLPVINDKNQLLGVVTVDDVMAIATERDTREMQRFGGLESLDYPYVKTPFFSLIKKRAGWLIILFLSEMLTATAMGYFEAEIAKAVMLALFVPLIISSGGNSGSQAATLIIRALSVKELGIRDWWYVMRRELLSGLTLGLVLGIIGFIRIAVWQELHWYNYGPHWILLAITIFFSLIGIITWGTLSGSMIPIVLKKLKQDPAASSAPFVATLVDVTGLVIYFTIAAIVLKGTLL
ncbi:magnesium transporter [Chitinophagaceae bacterium MMS25-I14]